MRYSATFCTVLSVSVMLPLADFNDIPDYVPELARDLMEKVHLSTALV